MKLGGEILSNAYRLLNVPTLTDTLTGGIYFETPVRSQAEDVEINLLANVNNYVQSGYVNVNVYVKHDDKGGHIKRLDELLNIITSLIDKKSIGNNAFEVESQSGYIRDDRRELMSFVNLKIRFQII